MVTSGEEFTLEVHRGGSHLMPKTISVYLPPRPIDRRVLAHPAAGEPRWTEAPRRGWPSGYFNGECKPQAGDFGSPVLTLMRVALSTHAVAGPNGWLNG